VPCKQGHFRVWTRSGHLPALQAGNMLCSDHRHWDSVMKRRDPRTRLVGHHMVDWLFLDKPAVNNMVEYEARLKASERDLRSIILTIPTMVWSAAPDGSVDFFNPRWLDYTGLSPDQSRDWRWSAAIHPDDLSRLTDAWQSILVSGESGETEARLRHFDGAYRWFLFRANPLRDESGNIVKWYGINLDIEDRKRAEEALRRSESYLAEAQRLSQTGSWAWSPDQDIRYWSEECYRVLSFDPQDGLPRFEEFFQRIHPDDQPSFRELIQTAIREKGEWEVDYRIVHPDGPVRDIHVVGHPVLSTSGHLTAYCLCLLHRTGTRPRRWPYLDLNLSVVNVRQYRRRLHHGSRFSAAISNASIATSHAVVPCSDLGSVKICRLASSSVRSVLPSGKTTGRSRRLSQDTKQLRNRTLDSRKRGGDSFRRRAVAGPRGPIDPSPASGVPNDGLSDPD
jgi:PAS domain S-box-containing protein